MGLAVGCPEAKTGVEAERNPSDRNPYAVSSGLGGAANIAIAPVTDASAMRLKSWTSLPVLAGAPPPRKVSTIQPTVYKSPDYRIVLKLWQFWPFESRQRSSRERHGRKYRVEKPDRTPTLAIQQVPPIHDRDPSLVPSPIQRAPAETRGSRVWAAPYTPHSHTPLARRTPPPARRTP